MLRLSPLLVDPPGRIFAVVAGGEEADLVAIRIHQVSLTPEPRSVRWWFGEFKAEGCEAVEFGVNVFAFEIKNDAKRRHAC